ncbi:MAG: phosphodiester glycosidase family protein [Ruminiclostridium sp.]|nr:phosphodiester glycosidase family protein [Ruminiclostridium sp.]
MVCVDSGMPLKAAAALMVDLGCDFAVNMDGGGSTEMRIKDGYGAGGAVTSGNGRALPTAVCAFTKV